MFARLFANLITLYYITHTLKMTAKQSTSARGIIIEIINICVSSVINKY